MITQRKILLVGANGYIGSRFYDRLHGKYNITCIDNGLKPFINKANNFSLTDYRDIDDDFLSDFSDCIWLAGHSSVPQSLQDPVGCFQNNLVGLALLQERFNGRLIYASSGSVYNGKNGRISSEKDSLGAPLNIYDFTKSTFDNYLNFSKKKNWIALRFGTVVGASQKMRTELLLNKMVLDAIEKKELTLANPSVLRPILFIDDLVNALDSILTEPNVSGEVFNLCSMTASMSDYANQISAHFSVPIRNLPNSSTYNFGMTAEKFSSQYNFSFTTDLQDIISNIKKGYLEGCLTI